MRRMAAVVAGVLAVAVVTVGGAPSAEAAAPPGIVTGADFGSGPHVRVFDAQARLSAEWMAGCGSGAQVATGDITGTAAEEIWVRTASAFGEGSQVRSANGAPAGNEQDSCVVAACASPCLLREPSGGGVALGDVDDDGRAERVAGSYTGGLSGGGPSTVGVQGLGGDGASSTNFVPYPGFGGGVYVAVGDIDGNGREEIVTGAGAGGGPHVRIWEVGADNVAREEGGFFAFDPAFRGGVRVATANVDSDSADEIVVAAGPGGGPHVRAFNGNGAPTPVSFFAYDPRFTAGVHVAAGDADGDLRDEIVTAPGRGGGPHVRMFERDGSPTPVSFFAYDPAMTAGVNVAVLNRTGSGSSQGGSGGTQTSGGGG